MGVVNPKGMLVRIARKGQGRNRKIGKDGGQAYREERKKKWWVRSKGGEMGESGEPGEGRRREMSQGPLAGKAE